MNPPFHKRFNIKVNQEEARRRFVNRVVTLVLDPQTSEIFPRDGLQLLLLELDPKSLLAQVIAALGEQYDTKKSIDHYINGNFLRCLQAIEALYEALNDWPEVQSRLDHKIKFLLSHSEVDLEVMWQDGVFYPSGAKELDQALVNEPLEWLERKGYESVSQPFRKGLRHFLESGQDRERLFDAITDVYEALEALAKIVTGRKKDLSANAEKFIKEVRASQGYKALLKAYISFANEFRHGKSDKSKRPTPSKSEVESFIYLTGIFIRLVMQSRLDAAT